MNMFGSGGLLRVAARFAGAMVVAAPAVLHLSCGGRNEGPDRDARSPDDVDGAVEAVDGSTERATVGEAPDVSSSSPNDGPMRDDAADLDAGGDDMPAPVPEGAAEAAPDVWCEGPPCPTPVFTPPGGKIALTGDGVTISLPSGAPEGTTVFYTTDGTPPTHQSSVYTGPIFLMFGPAILRAFAVAPCVCTDSPFATAEFTVVTPDAGAPD